MYARNNNQAHTKEFINIFNGLPLAYKAHVTKGMKLICFILIKIRMPLK